MSDREPSITVDQRRVISQADGRHWFPTLLLRLPDEGLLVGYSVAPDEMTGNLVTGVPHALLKSIDNGANWFPLKVVSGGLYDEAFPICVLPDGRVYGMNCGTVGALADEDGNPFVLSYLSSDSARSWDGPTIVPLRFPPEIRLPEPTAEPGRSRLSFQFEGNILAQAGGALIRIADGKFVGDQSSRVFLMRSTDEGRSWEYVSTIADPQDDGRHFNESALVEVSDGELLCVMRTDLDGLNPMYQARSTDGGHSWTRPGPIGVNGVRPQMVKMNNGVIACSYGRLNGFPSEAVQVMFSCNGGETWTQKTTIYEKASTGYTALLEVRPDELALIYDELDYGWSHRNAINMVRISVCV